ncbi:MAG: hypothetical protein ACNFW9_05750 [Candidatus Kerfeldbacteria bacterium]
MNKKKIFISLGIVIIAGVILLLIWSQGGVTKKGQFSKCMEVCYDLLIMDSSKTYCPEQCTNDTGFDPTQKELDEIIADITNIEIEKEDDEKVININTTTNVNKAIINVNTTINTNTVTTNINSEIDQTAEFYCEWSWPQKIIYKDTKKVIIKCSSDQPWCNRADGTYDNVSCCTDDEYLDCTNLDNLLN